MVLQILSILVSLGASAASTTYQPVGDCDQEIRHSYYNLCYSKEHRQALWVFHKSTLANINGSQKRTNDFRRDPNVDDPVGSRDYSGSGYDRGHLVPAGDMKLNKTSMSETFFMTNISPQNPNMNRGIWGSLENRIRAWIRRGDGDAYIVTAPVLEDNLKTIDSGVAIPRYFYKVIYFPDLQIMKAFLIPNERPVDSNFYNFSVSVDEVEDITGLDFFADLPDDVEDELESINYYDN
ncbi:MAG: DNA/RNA non-specific endonuclease [Bdellovibrionales bacterium]|nr:DNA/RNA non-specific endonuclease [Bdellovibrionales bacterium]